jgi:hypothetical protein
VKREREARVEREREMEWRGRQRRSVMHHVRGERAPRLSARWGEME